MRATVTITIDYDEAQSSSDKDIERALNFAVQHIANNGLLSNEESVVDEWRYQVEVAPNRKEDKKFVYKGFYETVNFAKSLGWVDNHPDCDSPGFDAGMQSFTEDEALEFIKTKGYVVEFEE
tara:strand:+ start:1578 stop:1943 length:366 start_codon:yes stop_codon:yes gene_type:complete